MVTRILLDPRRDLLDGTTGSNPVTVTATPTGISEAGQVVVLPTSLTFTIATAADVFQLPPSSASWKWRLVVRDVVSNAILQQRTVLVPDVASLAYADLPDVDPTSLGDTISHSRNWDATFAHLLDLIQQVAVGEIGDAGIASLITTPASAVAASLAATYPTLNGNNRLAIGATQLAPTTIGAEFAGAAAAITLSALGGIDSATVDSKVATAVTNLLNGAPGALDTLKELADALGDDANFAATLAAQIALKLNSSDAAATYLALANIDPTPFNFSLVRLAGADQTVVDIDTTAVPSSLVRLGGADQSIVDIDPTLVAPSDIGAEPAIVAGTTTTFLRGDKVFAALPAATSSAAGAVQLATNTQATTGTDTTTAVTPAAAAAAISAGVAAGAPLTVNAQTGTTYTAAATDVSALTTMNNASAIVYTIPPNSSVAIAVGRTLRGSALGAGQVTITAGAGVTINARGGALKSAGQYAVWELVKVATDTWVAVGDLST